jgi:hypothetical protein
MGVFAKKGDQEDPGGSGGGSGLHLDLDERFCVICRRALLPWQETCDRDGGNAVALADLPSSMPPPPSHLLGDDPDE